MQFRYEIVTKLGGTDQVGLRLQCNQQSQAEEIHRELRQASFRVSRLMSSSHQDYSHFFYITATESDLRNAMPKIAAKIRGLDDVGGIKVAPASQDRKVPTIHDFRSWQNQFRRAVKQLNKDYLRPTSSVQEIDRNRLEQQIAAGRATEVEEQLLRQADLNDSSALRSLIALYARTDRIEQLVELCKAKRSSLLALPASGRLVEQLVSAHLQHYQQTTAPESLRSAQHIAQEFLPELERLRQANGVRKLLHQAVSPQEPLPSSEGATLNEQLVQLLEIEPAERIPQMEALSRKYPRAVNVLLALAESYAASDNIKHALEIYQSVPVKTEEVQQRCAELLLAGKRFREVLKLLPASISDLSPALAGLRGAALYNLGQKTQACELLEKAWLGGERRVQVLLPLARLWATVGDPEKAAAVYQILRETAEEILTLQDYALIATVANLGGFGDISDEQKVNYYEECVTLAGSRLLSLSVAEDILKDRLELWKQLHKIEELLNAYADWLDWLAKAGRMEDLENELANLRAIAGTQQINRKRHFELLESLEPYVDALPRLRKSLANDYQAIALAEIDNALRQARLEEPFLQDLKRALHNLDRESVHELVKYRQQCRAEAQKLDLQIASEDGTALDTPDLSSLKLALIGGHETTRREVIRELKEFYGLEKAVEVAPSSEAYVDRSSVQAKLSDCRLIAAIVGYMGHDLSKIVSELKKDGALVGEVLLLPCRGKSGVVREILNWWVGG